MKIILTALAFSLGIQSALAFNCTAKIDRYENSTVTTITKDLEGDLEKKKIDIEEAYFSFSDYQNGAFTAQISIGPDYTTGNLAKGVFDQNGQFKLSYITPNNSYILVCSAQE